MPFWTTPQGGTGRDPKRGFRFRISINNISGGDNPSPYMWYAKTVDKPSLEISTTEHDYLNHKFRFPGKTVWQPVTMKMVDPTDPDMSATLSDLVQYAGYHPPSQIDDHTSMSKSNAISTLGDVIIEQVDAQGAAIERWTLKNAWISKVTYGSLDYSSDELTELELEFQYDWAQIDTPKGKSGRVGTDGRTSWWDGNDPYGTNAS